LSAVRAVEMQQVDRDFAAIERPGFACARLTA
jgi:hypothetical protein